jgi:hypothetical protein
MFQGWGKFGVVSSREHSLKLRRQKKAKLVAGNSKAGSCLGSYTPFLKDEYCALLLRFGCSGGVWPLCDPFPSAENARA